MKKLLATLAVALGTWLCAAPASAAVVTFSPSSTHIGVGESVSIDMNISGLGPEILSAFDIDLLFDAAVVSNFAVTHWVVTEFGGYPANSVADTTFGAGRTEVVDYSLLDDATLAATQSDSFKVLTFSFVGLSDGVSLLSLGLDTLFERNFVGLNALSLTVDVGTACIAVGTGSCQAPEPSSLALAGLALAGVLGASLRRRREEREAD
jgi:hypothetical protein